MKTNNKKVTCINCKRRIINPVCIQCRLRQIHAWLNDQKIILPEKKELLLKETATFFPKKSDNIMMCIYCKKNNVSVCTYCFFSRFEKLLLKLDISASSIDSFQKIFNYRLYSKDFD